MIQILLWCAAGYLALGVGITLLLSQTPYSENPWWLTTLLWPLVLFGIMFG